MVGRIKALWEQLRAFNRDRLVSSLTTLTKDEYNSSFSEIYGNAKLASDFVAMFLRFGFLVLALRYFIAKVSAVTTSEATFLTMIEAFVFAYAAAAVTFMLAILTGNLMLLVTLYLSHRIYEKEGKCVKRSMAAGSILGTFLILYAIVRMAGDLAESSGLLS